MLHLHVIQADHGDCFLLGFGDGTTSRYLLVDGGPQTVYERHLKGEIERIVQGDALLELALLSHVDDDHAIGLLDLMAEIGSQRANGQPELVAINGLWHNAFAKAIDTDSSIASRLRAALAAAGAGNTALTSTAQAVNGIGEGERLRVLATQLGIPVNNAAPSDLICVDDMTNPVKLRNLTLRVVGPTRANLNELKQEWLAWLDKFEPDLASGDPLLMSNADKSVPNLSSIMVFAEADGKTVLFTGDGRSDHLLQGLDAAGVLDNDGCVHVDVFKVPHHGSDRNVTKRFFEKVTADIYVVSANGHPDNPDLATLIWIVEAARKQGRQIRIVATNERPSTTKLIEEYDPSDYHYSLEVMPAASHCKSLELAH